MATEGSASSTAAVTTTGAAVATTSTAAATTTETTPATSASPTADAGATTSAAPGPNGTLTIMSHDNFVLSKDVVTKFEQANGVALQFLKAGDAGAALNKAILAKNNPLADVFFGVDNTFFSRAIDADIFAPYTPAALQAVPSDFKLDPQNRLIPVDYGFVNLNYDVAAFGAGKLPLPQTLRDLVKPEYKGKLVAESPATSSTGLAFMLATIATFGETGSYTWVDYWKDLHKNDVQIVDGWDTAYNKNFSGSAGKGVQPIVVSYGTSPAYELDASAGKLKEPPTGNMVPPNGAFRQIEFVGVLKGSKHVDLARKWVDYMLSADVQNDVMPQMVVYPVVPSATLPDVYKQYAPVPQQPAVIAPDVIAKNRDRWIQQWTDAVGQ
ncbi:MAG: thiamine ABC transporter substrate-binding protein [Herpetosiphonaceae bacterium]|nr:thiamine ABC transporter substrate-binding protein [Herpetosiphonaceae bacterium]